MQTQWYRIPYFIGTCKNHYVNAKLENQIDMKSSFSKEKTLHYLEASLTFRTSLAKKHRGRLDVLLKLGSSDFVKVFLSRFSSASRCYTKKPFMLCSQFVNNLQKLSKSIFQNNRRKESKKRLARMFCDWNIQKIVKINIYAIENLL